MRCLVFQCTIRVSHPSIRISEVTHIQARADDLKLSAHAMNVYHLHDDDHHQICMFTIIRFSEYDDTITEKLYFRKITIQYSQRTKILLIILIRSENHQTIKSPLPKKHTHTSSIYSCHCFSCHHHVTN